MSVGSLILILGILNLVLLGFQLVSGMHWVKVPIRLHRRTGMVLVASAVLHGSLALLADLL